MSPDIFQPPHHADHDCLDCARARRILGHLPPAEVQRQRELGKMTTSPGHRTIRVISTFVQTPRFWRADLARFSRGYRDGSRPDLHGGDAERTRKAAATAELWGLPVGVVTSVRRERL